MGTTWSVKVVSGGAAAASATDVRSLVEDHLVLVEARMSHYRETSEVSRFNAAPAAMPFPISRETAEVVRHALEIAEATGGALDITVGPLVVAWGFGPGGESPEPPSDAEIVRLLEATGPEHLRLDFSSSTLAKDVPGLRIDLSAVAKGYAVDRVAAALLEAGHGGFLVELGGEIRVHGANADGGPWRLAIERPDADGRSLHTVVALREGSLATSGDYRLFHEAAGRRISHIIDPRTGRPVEHLLASVSVIAPQCVRADGFATALLVLGPDHGPRLAEELGLAALFLIRHDRDQFTEKATSRFRERVARNETPRMDSWDACAGPGKETQ